MNLTDLPQALLTAMIRPLATLLRPAAGDDTAVAWDAAIRTVLLQDPYDIAELRLIVRVETFSLQAAEAAAQAGQADIPPQRAIRLRSGAVALSREAEKAERRLEKLRAARDEAAATDQPPAAQAQPDLLPEAPDPPPAASEADTGTDGLTRILHAAASQNSPWPQAPQPRDPRPRDDQWDDASDDVWGGQIWRPHQPPAAAPPSA